MRKAVSGRRKKDDFQKMKAHRFDGELTGIPIRQRDFDDVVVVVVVFVVGASYSIMALFLFCCCCFLF